MDIRRLLLAVLLLAAAQPLAAQGIIVPDRCRDCRPWVPGQPRQFPATLPVESVEIDTRIDGQVATTHVTQVFRNETGLTLEGTYLFPIPSSASITEFVLWDGDRRLVGEVRSREEARRIYDAIVRRQRDPGLLEYAGENLFQASIFPILPRSTKKLEITYTQVLKAENGAVGYRYPLGLGRNTAPVERVSGRVRLASQGRLGTVYSPSHEIDVRRGGTPGGRAEVSFESGRRDERRDFQLFYGLSDREVGMSLFTYREPGKDGFFLLLLTPPDDADRREYPAKDVVYVLDTSGSMEEDGKMDKARRALIYGLRGLGPDDRFNVVAFSGETRLFEEGLVRADRANRDRAIRFVEGLHPVGGTNINDAMVEGLEQFPAGGTRPRLVVFLTDGLPTVGVTDVDRIIASAARARRGETRLFTFGVGYDVNTRLLDRVAAENGGAADYVEPQEDLEAKVSGFFDKVNHPVLTNLRLDMGPVRTDLVYPRALPDLFKGAQVALVGRYRNAEDLRNVTVRLSGNASPTRTFTYTGLSFPRRAEEHEFLPRLWATRRVGWLMEQVRTHGENRELRDEIVELGTRYGIVTPYTSYLALEPGAEARAEDFSGVGRTGGVVVSPASPRANRGAPAAAAPPPVTGAGAVQQSKAEREMQEVLSLESVTPSGAGAESIRRVGGKTFYLREGVWTDSEIRAGARLPETSVRFGSDEYYALIQRTPALARYFALGEKVAVVHEGRVYRAT